MSPLGTIHVSADLVYGWTVQCSGHPKHVHLLSAVFFQFHLEEKICKLGEISQERLKIVVKLLKEVIYMLRRLTQQRKTLSDLKWPFH